MEQFKQNVTMNHKYGSFGEPNHLQPPQKLILPRGGSLEHVTWFKIQTLYVIGFIESLSVLTNFDTDHKTVQFRDCVATPREPIVFGMAQRKNYFFFFIVNNRPLKVNERGATGQWYRKEEGFCQHDK